MYDIDGNTIESAYSVSGDVLGDAYDIDGNKLGKYDISNVASYFQTETLSVASDINALSDDWQSFVFITDPHGNGNKNHSQAIGLYLLDNTKASMIVLGGDYSVGYWSSATEYSNYVSAFLNSGLVNNIYAIYGNHERPSSDSVTTSAKQYIYNDFLKDKNNITGVLTDNYYYFDDTQKKMRYMFLNTSDGSDQYTMSSGQLEWIAENVVMPSSEWSLVVIGHVNLVKMANVTTANQTNGSSIVSAIENCNGTIVGYFCGHQHIDYTEKIGNFQYTTMLCDKFENTNYYNGISVTDRVSGTDSEQAVSVISINTSTKNVVVRRIGAGRQRTMSYSYS